MDLQTSNDYEIGNWDFKAEHIKVKFNDGIKNVSLDKEFYFVHL